MSSSSLHTPPRNEDDATRDASLSTPPLPDFPATTTATTSEDPEDENNVSWGAFSLSAETAKQEEAVAEAERMERESRTPNEDETRSASRGMSSNEDPMMADTPKDYELKAELSATPQRHAAPRGGRDVGAAESF